MTTQAAQLPLPPAAAATLQRWHAMVERGDFGGVEALLAPQAVFRSPVAHTAYQPASAVALVLRTVIEVFEDFEYHRQFATSDGQSVVLEFSARVGDKQLRGIDLLRLNDQGQIEEMEVMVRPLSGLQALAAAMGARLGGQQAALKGEAGTGQA